MVEGLPARSRAGGERWARRYFALQGVAGAVWWLLVFTVPTVRSATLGGLSPRALVVPDLALFCGLSLVVGATGGRVPAVLCGAWTVAVTLLLGGYATATRAAGWGAALMVAATVGALVAGAQLWWGRVPTTWLFRGPFRFRPSPPATARACVARSARQTALFWFSSLAVLPLVLTAGERRWRIAVPFAPPPVRLAGGLLLVAGSALGLWSMVTMAVHGAGTPLPAATARELVAVGPYRWVRNPMAVAGVAQLFGVGLLTGSWSALVAALFGGAIWDAAIRPAEEADLLARFSDSYAAYRTRVRCWVPAPNAQRSDHSGA